MLLALLMACTGSEPPPDVTVDAWVGDAITTSLFLDFDTPGAAAAGLTVAGATVQAGDRSWTLRTDGQLQGHLPALPEDSALSIQPWVELDGERLDLAPLQLQTGALPDDLVRPQVEGDPVPTWTFTGHGLATWVPMLLAPDGTPAWWVQPDWGDTAVIRLRPLPDGSGLRLLRFPILAAGGEGEVPAGFVDLGWDGELLQQVDLPGVHHDFCFLPDGRTAWLVFDGQEIDGETIYGDQLWVGEPGGQALATWSSWDWIGHDPEREEEAAGRRYATLANAVEYDPFHDRLLVGIKNFGAVVSVDVETGAQRWRLSAEDGDLELLEPGRHPSGQHGIEATSDGFRLFDNGRSEDGDSRVVAYAIDETARTAEQLWEHSSDPPHYGLVLGDVRDLGEGRSRIAWSALGVLEDIDEQGQVLGRIQVDEDAFVGFVHVDDDPFPLVQEQ